MKKLTRNIPRVLIAVLVLVAGAMMAGCNLSIPFTANITPDPEGSLDMAPLNLGNISGISFGNATPGSPIPDALRVQETKLCSGAGLITLNEINSSANSGVSFSLSSITINEIVLKATSGNFDYLTSVSVKWRPKAENGEQPADIDFGTGQISSTEIVLDLPQPVNFLDLLKNAEQGPAEECPSLIVTIDGTVPSVAPAWETLLNRGTISGTVSL